MPFLFALRIIGQYVGLAALTNNDYFQLLTIRKFNMSMVKEEILDGN